MPKLGSRIQLIALAGALALVICLGLTACGSSSSSTSEEATTSEETNTGGPAEENEGEAEGGETKTASTLKPGDISEVCPEEPTKMSPGFSVEAVLVSPPSASPSF